MSHSTPSPPEGPNPSGLCMCGCGEAAPIATQTWNDRGVKKGEYFHYIKGHALRGRHYRTPPPPPNPSGLCLCGCGQKTNIAKSTSYDRGCLKGHPLAYVTGHNRNSNTGGSPEVQERQRAATRKWHAANKEYANAQAAKRYAAHREEVRRSNAEWRAANPAYKREWRRRNPDKVTDYVHRRRARLEGTEHECTAEELGQQREVQEDCCYYCGVELDGGGHVEHMTPLARGGSHTIDNIVWSCAPCNYSKSTKTAEEFFALMDSGLTG